MRNLGLFISLFLLTFWGKAQKNYTIVYRYVFASNDTLAIVSPANCHLVVQDSISFTYNPDSFSWKKVKIPLPIGSGYWAKATYCLARKNLKIIPGGYYNRPKTWRLIETKLDRGEWQIETEQKLIAGFLCTRATGIIDNRKCTAWFCKDFPGGYGPYILTDLPGAILEIIYDDTKGRFVAVQTSDTALPMIEPNYCKRIRG